MLRTNAVEQDRGGFVGGVLGDELAGEGFYQDGLTKRVYPVQFQINR